MNLISLNPKHVMEKIDDAIFSRSFIKRYGIPRHHVRMKSNKWSFVKMNAEDYETLGIIPGKNGNMLAAYDKWRQELIDHPASTARPKPIRVKETRGFGCFTKTYERTVPFIIGYNVLLLTGLEQSAKRDTGDAADSGVTHCRLGSDGTAEDESHTDILRGIGNVKAYDTDGQRSVPSGTQSSKYTMTFIADDDGYNLPATVQELAQFNAASSYVAHSRIKIPSFTLAAGEAILSQLNETMQNG